MKGMMTIFLVLVFSSEQTILFGQSSAQNRPTLYDKMNRPIYVPGTNVKTNTDNPLWINSKSSETTEYAKAVVSKAPKELGKDALIVFGGIGTENAIEDFGTKEKPVLIEMVSSSIEYYFTNKVFIEGKYKEALIDLLQYRAEVPAKQKVVDETAIPGTLWVAEQNGVKIDMDEVKKEFAAQIGAQIDQCAQVLVDYYKKSIPSIGKYMNDFSSVLKAYYADPLPIPAKLDMILDKALEIEKKTLADSPGKDVPVFISWSTLVMSTVGKISNSLDLAIATRKKERSAQVPVLDPIEFK
jgi:hypothetical protein